MARPAPFETAERTAELCRLTVAATDAEALHRLSKKTGASQAFIRRAALHDYLERRGALEAPEDAPPQSRRPTAIEELAAMRAENGGDEAG
jgi:hypothetical protein